MSNIAAPGVTELYIYNRQKGYCIDRHLLRQITEALLQRELGLKRYDLGIYLVGSKKSAEINSSYLGHEGPTDVITFPYDSPANLLHGELFVCIEVAELQSHEFNTSWQQELIRYVVHGVLHLQGYDDLTSEKRKKMKRVEDQLVKRLETMFQLSALGKV
ncbi:MAG: rRNA maturation RNase YbeY [Verrucomicrobiota bacterium]|nr:rRNA maturation RNase YbeY [Verrucomicrobiota bacterium]